MNKLTVSRSLHILASIINKHARRRELLYDIIHQERLDEDLENLEVAITHTNDDDNSIPITFDLTLILLAHHIENTYSRTIHEWIKSHPIRIVDRRNPSAIEPPFGTECIRIRWTGSGVDVWSRRRLFDIVAPTLTNRSKPKRPLHRTQCNTIANYFKPIQAATPRKRHLTEEGQAQSGPSSKVKSRKIYTPSTQEPVNSDNEYEHRQKRRAHIGKMTEYHKLLIHLPASKVA